MKKTAAVLAFVFLVFLVFGKLKDFGIKKTDIVEVNTANAQASPPPAINICSSKITDDVGKMAYGQTIGYLSASHGSVGFEPKIDAAGLFSGMVYSQTAGWVSLTGVSVNCTTGVITGNAYGQTIGYINFGNTGVPKIDQTTGLFSGYAYSQTAGWISLDGWKVEPARFLEIESINANPPSFTNLDPIPYSSEITITIKAATLTALPPFKYEFDCNGDGDFNDTGVDKNLTTDLTSGSQSCQIPNFASLPKTINVKVASIANPEAYDTGSLTIGKVVMQPCKWNICESIGPGGRCGFENHTETHPVVCPPNPTNPNVTVCSSDADCFSGGKDWIEVNP